MSLQWHGPQVKRQIVTAMRQRLRACAILVSGHAKELVSTEGTGARAARSRRIKSWKNTVGYVPGVANRTLASGKKQAFIGQYHRKSKGSLIYGHNPSKPGDPPHLQTGRLRGSIAWTMVAKVVARVGTNLKYGKHLELGTKYMAARPWLRVALTDLLGTVRRILTAPLNLS